jgi:hypothetical protein
MDPHALLVHRSVAEGMLQLWLSSGNPGAPSQPAAIGAVVEVLTSPQQEQHAAEIMALLLGLLSNSSMMQQQQQQRGGGCVSAAKLLEVILGMLQPWPQVRGYLAASAPFNR